MVSILKIHCLFSLQAILKVRLVILIFSEAFLQSHSSLMPLKTSLPYLLLHLTTSYQSDLWLRDWIWHECPHLSAALFHFKISIFLFVLNSLHNRFPIMSLIEKSGLDHGSFSMCCEKQVLNDAGRIAVSLNLCLIHCSFEIFCNLTSNDKGWSA